MHATMSLFGSSYPTTFILPAIAYPLMLVAIVWSLVLKGFALWYAARGGQKWWYIALLIVNTLGILEIIYLIWFRPRSFELEKPDASSPTPAA